MVLRSRSTRLNVSPASQVRSKVAPVRRLRSFKRTIAPPRPILTCCHSSTLHGCPSNSKVMPFFKSPVDIMGITPLSLSHQVAVFDAHARPARDVHAGLNGDNRADR